MHGWTNLGEKDAADGGWFYNADGLIEQNPNNSVASAGATMTYLGNNCFVFAPWNYYKENFAVGSHITEKSSYDDIYTEAGLFQTYSNDLMSIAKFDNQTDERRKLIKADLDTAITEWIATFVSEGVTDSSWNEFTKVIEDIGMEEFIEIYQTGLDNLQLAE